MNQKDMIQVKMNNYKKILLKYKKIQKKKKILYNYN